MKTVFFSLFFLLFLNVTVFSQIAINYDGTQAATHTVLDVKSDTTGMIIPRMTTAQRNTLAGKLDASHKGMIVYDNSLMQLYFWNSTEFEAVESGGVSKLADADDDTYIDVESGADPDYIDIASGGTVYWRFENARFKFLNTGGSVFVGENAGQNDDLTSNENVFVGKNAGYLTTTGVQNVAIGRGALTNNQGGQR